MNHGSDINLEHQGVDWKSHQYAENPDKTKENNEGQIAEDQSRSTQGLNDVITYAVNAEKIRRRQSESMEMELVGEAEELMEQYVSGVNCAPTTAREEMIAVKIRADRPEEEIQEMKEGPVSKHRSRQQMLLSKQCIIP